MKWLFPRTTQARIAWLIGALALAAAINAILAINNAASFQQQLAQVESYTAALQQHSDARASLLKELLAIKNTFISTEGRAKDWGDQERYANQFGEYLYFQEMRDGKDAAVQTLLDQNKTLGEKIVTFFEKLLADDPDIEELAALNLDGIDPAAASMETGIQALAGQDLKDLRSQIAAIQRQSQADMLIGQIALIVLAILIIWGVYTTLRISIPLDNLTGAIVAFENNTYKPELLANDVKRSDDLGQLARAVGGMAQSISESNQLKEQFLQSAQRFIPTQYLEFLEKDSITKVKLGDHVSAEMAVMFSDIRGFSTLSEKMTAQENFDFVNEYLKLVSPIIQEYDGFIVKFLGDGMMAIFPYGVADAVRAGIKKAAMVQQFNQQLKARGMPPISVGIGIHTGPMMVGMIGEELRMQGDAFSDNVNLTSRIEGLTKFFGTSLLISEDSLRQLPQPVTIKMRFLGKVVVKGRVGALGIYEILEGLPEGLAASKTAALPHFDRALGFYSQGRFSEAGQAFYQALQLDPGDKTARYYLESCAERLNQPLPANWDGSIVMEGK
jgi:adenylate cyclase